MKQIISFKKDIPFDTKISEITSISLEHNLKLISSDEITGEFMISGDYKITENSINRESFSHNLPFDINLDTKYNIEKASINIDDFYYEIIDEHILNVNIDVLIEGIISLEEFEIEKESVIVREEKEPELEIVEDEEIIDLFKEIETPPIDIVIEDDNKEIDNNQIKSLFENLDESSETFTTYHVHIVRENDNIDTIIAKYKTTKEEIMAYNKIDEIKLGDKIVIPAISYE